MNGSFATQTKTLKIEKGANGFGIALNGGAKTVNQFTGDTGIFVSDVLQGPAFGLLIAGDKVLEINGISMEKAEKPQATDLLKRSKTATFKVARRVPTNPMSTMMAPMGQMPVQMQQYQAMMQNSTMNPQQTMQFQQQMNEQMMLNQTQQAPPPVQNMGDVINSAEGQKRLKNFEPSEESEDFSSDEEKKPKKNKKKHRKRSSSYSSRSSSRGRTKTSKSKKKSKARKSSSSYSRGSSVERELAQIKIRDKYAVIPVKAHEPRTVTLKKSHGQSFGMKLGTRVFVQSINPGGVAENNDVNQNDLILSVNGASTDSLTIPEVLEKIKGSDTLVLEVQQIDGGTVTLPSTVLNQSSSERGSSSKHSSSKKGSKSSKSHHRSSSRHRSRDHRRRSSSDDYRDDYRYKYSYTHEPVVNQKSTHV
ncbi:Oidioi.mRNA.OKI2018_I69.PAR.g10730.t1.cds [Oikopleura dioica]|uniref:Oidioi.mRNA.OKI2018_I69.PAR.g10730.t1.cds n=1 Tax=Oikopleura dioica TaxID=34765 RepID=A0ABN7RS18_OIKDI|nr:Oidioi.mRNA.OKI2018_I69.PAR.g10730.t1.cds [Oikopleura dioica]